MMPEPSDIAVTVTPARIARILINRPEVANAIRPETMKDLCAAIDLAIESQDVRALVISGAGRNFAAGADFQFLRSLLDKPTDEVNDSLYAWFKGTTERLWNCPKPTVAAVNGAAITVGCEIALACDVRVASKRSRFGENWLQLGLMPPLGGAVLLPRIVGLTHAKRMILEAQIVGGAEALRIGLVDELVDDGAVLRRAEERAIQMAAYPARAFAAAKAAIHRGFESSMDREWKENVLTQAQLIGTDDFRTQVRARLDAKEESLSDREQIRQLQLAYVRLFDARDADGFAELYTDDAVLIQAGGKEIRTKEKFRKSVVNMPPKGDGFHNMLDSDIVVDGDTARARTRFEARSSISGAEMAGYYEDEYRRTREGWRFTRRAVLLDE